MEKRRVAPTRHEPGSTDPTWSVCGPSRRFAFATTPGAERDGPALDALNEVCRVDSRRIQSGPYTDMVTFV